MAKHNKKRNVGLIHEQLVRYAASALIAEDKKFAEKAIQIISKHFKPNTELYKEFRLFNALINAPVGSRPLAERVVKASQEEACKHNGPTLDREKSLLIKDINKLLAEASGIYDIKIENYKLFATVQTILNEWRGANELDMIDKAKYEESLVEWLSRSSNVKVEESMYVDPLIRKLMLQKFQEKYKDKLGDEQKRVLEVSIVGTDEQFCQIINEVKRKAMSSLDKFENTCDNKILKDSITEVKKRVFALPQEKSDDVVAKTLHLIHLIEEMESNER